MKLIYGKKVAKEILARIKQEIKVSEATPELAVVLVGQNEASRIYINLKKKAAEDVGIQFFLFQFPEEAREEEILKRIEELNADEKINGIIVQLPLPKGLDAEKLIGVIDPAKDADGFHPENLKKFFAGGEKINPVFPKAILKIFKSVAKNLAGQKAVVIAKSENFGRTMLAMLKKEDMEVEIIFCHEVAEKAIGKLEKIKQADLVISACGTAGLLSDELFKAGVIVIDGGIKKIDKSIYGDADRKIYASSKYGFISPVPGGVGPVTVACLLENVWLLSQKNS